MLLVNYWDEVEETRSNQIRVKDFSDVDEAVTARVYLDTRGVMTMSIIDASYKTIQYESWAYAYAPHESEKMLKDGEYLALMAEKAYNAVQNRKKTYMSKKAS